MSNILKACCTISKLLDIEISKFDSGKNRINNVGKGLEIFIQNIFADTFQENDEQKRLKTFSQVYSYLGNKNNPPDLILKNGDAIEIKKIESLTSEIALNSSYPKAKLYSNNPMITSACRECENWQEKDIIYIIGYIKDNFLKRLWMIYGDCYAADQDIYEKIKLTISGGINTIPDVEFTETKELGKVKKVDPLGITNLRIRGMWHIANPIKVFDYLYKTNNDRVFELIILMKKDKYLSFFEIDRDQIELCERIIVQDVHIKNPNNPVKLMDGKMITFS